MDKLLQDGTWWILVISSSIFLFIVAVGIIILVLVYEKRQLQYLNEKKQLRVAFEREILESKLEIQEQTFKNISQEIHDNIGQVLSLAKLNINTMNSSDPEGLEEKINDSRHLISKAIHDLRDLSKSLNTDFISEKGLLRSIEHETQLLKKAAVYTTDITINGEPYKLPPQKELILFRIFQEVVNNIIKHAKASAIVVHFCYNKDTFTLQISDNGQGFTLDSLHETPNHTLGLGIRNMQNRAQLIGARFTLESDTGKGTIVKIALPL